MKRFLTAFICILLIAVTGASQAVSAAPYGGASDGAQGEKAKRTILLYLCGSNLETDSAMATDNLMQIMNAAFSSDGDV